MILNPFGSCLIWEQKPAPTIKISSRVLNQCFVCRDREQAIRRFALTLWRNQPTGYPDIFKSLLFQLQPLKRKMNIILSQLPAASDRTAALRLATPASFIYEASHG